MAVSKIDDYHQALIASQKPAARFFVPGQRPSDEESEEAVEESQDDGIDAKVVAPGRRRTARATTDDVETK